MFQQGISNNTISGVANNGWSQTSLSSFLITSEETQGKAALLEAIQTKGNEPPRHSHQDTNEAFYVIDGKMTFYVDGETIAAPAGSSIFIERGKEHSFTVDTTTANTLILLTPA